MSSNLLANVTKVAVEEIIRSKTSESKYGYFLSEENFDELVDEILKLLETSRNLKKAGDRFLAADSQQSGPPARKGDVRNSV